MLRRVTTRISVDPIDLVALASVVMLAIGVAMVYVPASFIVVGVLGVLYAVAASRGESA